MHIHIQATPFNGLADLITLRTLFIVYLVLDVWSQTLCNLLYMLLASAMEMFQALPCLTLLIALLIYVTPAFTTISAHAASTNSAASNGSLLWGPYRPNLYFGVRPRIPKSLLTGLMWAKVDHAETVQNSESARPEVWNIFSHAKDFPFRVADPFRLQTYMRAT